MNPAIIITSSRLATALLFSFFFINGTKGSLYEAAKTYLILSILCAILIELSDAVDGIIARKRGEVTRFGKIFDPVCDSLSRQTVFISFMVVGIIPLWMYFIFMYRDAVLSLLRIMVAIHGSVMAAKTSGKLKAVIQAVGTFLVLSVVVCHTYNVFKIPHNILGMHPGFWIMIFPALFTFLSMFDYLIPNWHIVKKMMSVEK